MVAAAHAQSHAANQLAINQVVHLVAAINKQVAANQAVHLPTNQVAQLAGATKKAPQDFQGAFLKRNALFLVLKLKDVEFIGDHK